MPVGYRACAAAYVEAARSIDAHDLTHHYTEGLAWLRGPFADRLRAVLADLSGGVWDLRDFEIVAAGSDTDLMTHLVEAVAAAEGVAIYPGGWYGFLVGGTRDDGIAWTEDATGRMACLCIPSVRNGHLTEPMAAFLERADTCLLNLNLYPTLPPGERAEIARRLTPVLDRAVLSISFSRGFGMTASQLGVALVRRDHPFMARFERQWGWSTYFFNALAARAFMALDIQRLQAVDDERRAWVKAELERLGLPAVDTGSYYVRSFRPEGPVPEALAPLVRGDLVRLCFKPPQIG